MKKEKTLRIGITPGDPAGIGPEIALKAVNDINSTGDSGIIPVLIGGIDNFRRNYSSLAESYEIITPDVLESEPDPSKKYICPLEYKQGIHKPGKGTVESAAESLFYINNAVDLWKSGLIDAIVTGPVHKGLIERSGTPFAGHTEYIADRINEKDPLMLMYSPDYRVLLATTHIPVSQVAERLTKDYLIKIIKKGYESFCTIDDSPGQIAVCGLDPHCGDDGSIGTFDTEITTRTIETLKQEGVPLTGPVSADTLFLPEKWKTFSLAIALYHDQGMIPFKILAFEKGVNVTLGLSITRTSPDHGTAFDLAGKGSAIYSSMKEAILLARDLELNRQKNKN